MITVSVCMIVRNEEAVLARCLDSLTGLANEIVIADTGSADRTKEVAARYTRNVFDFPWNGDFSAARNFAFSRATMEYIYSADADEVLDAANRLRFLELKRTLSPETDIVQMRYANQLSYNTTYNFDAELRPKLFRRLRTFRWVDPVHETVELSPRVADSDITVLHMPQNLHSPRDFSILEKAAAAGTMSARLARMYAKELFISGADGDFLTAYPYFEAMLHDETRSLDEVRVAQCVVARAARLKNEPETLFKAALKNMIGEPCAEVCCELGAWFSAKGDWEEAATWYYTASSGVQSELDIRSSGSLPLLHLAECYEKLGMAQAAADCLAQASQRK